MWNVSPISYVGVLEGAELLNFCGVEKSFVELECNFLGSLC